MPTVLIIGGGLAGLAAATALAPRGFRVTVLESRNRLGGRASSFPDTASGQLIDACQHVSMGCCTQFARFCRTIGIDHMLETHSRLYFMTRDRRVHQLRADRWPAPFHLARSLLAAHYLTPLERLRVLWAMSQLLWREPEGDPPLLEWLKLRAQTARTIDRFWGTVLVSALNERVERLGLRYARKVFLEGFLRDPHGCEVTVPRVPLVRLYGDELMRWLYRHGARVLLNCGAIAMRVAGSRVVHIETRAGEVLHADWYIAAVPFDRLLALVPQELIEREEYFGNVRQLGTSPITSVHLWFDRAVLHLPHVVLIDCVGQWVFNRGEPASGEHYVQVVVSAARQFRGLGQGEVERQIVAELRHLFPAARRALLVRSRVVTDHAATFSPVPGVDRWRPAQESPLANLFVAGDWTATGWPATMEGAVRSGYLAAEAITKRSAP